MPKRFFTFIIWISGIYIFIFLTSFYVHINETNIISRRANALLPKITNENKTGIRKIAQIQQMKRKPKPVFSDPRTLLNSLFGKRESHEPINRLIRSRMELIKSGLDNAVLNHANLEGINLSNGNLFNAYLKKANLRNANLSNTNFAFARLENANLNQANLIHSNFYRTDLHGTILRGADLSGALNLTCGQVTSAIIDENTLFPENMEVTGPTSPTPKCKKEIQEKGLDLRNTYLVNADFLAENFANADLQGAILTGANLSKVTHVSCEQLFSATTDNNTKFPDYIYAVFSQKDSFKCINLLKGKGANLKAANLEGIFLDKGNLKGADLSDANLSKSHFYYTDFANASLKRANLKGANFETAYNLTCEQIKSSTIDKTTHLPDYIYLPKISDSKCISLLNGKEKDFSGANLSGIHLHDRGFKADLRNGKFTHANFKGARLGFTNFSNANLKNADLEQADLIGSNLTNALLKQTNLRGANLHKVINLTCDQVMSAITDKNTRLPDYIQITDFSKPTQNCKEIKITRINPSQG